MRFNKIIEKWQGTGLLLISCVGSLALAITGHLNLYIHPRYIVFTTIMAISGIFLGYLSFYLSPDASLDSISSPHVAQRRVKTFSLLIVCLLAAFALLIAPPATLTTSTVSQRGINSSLDSNVVATTAVPLFGSSDYTSFTVKDWASLLSQTNSLPFFTNKTADITGFIQPDPDDPQNVFYVARFVITCCAVDARPIGVPVYAPNWQAAHSAGEWVRVQGSFESNPSSKSHQQVALRPTRTIGVDIPKDPYVY